MTPIEYEKAVLERFRTLFPPPQFMVRHNVRIRGEKSRKQRQIDIAIYETKKRNVIITVDAKRQKRPVDVGKAGSTIALVQDIGRVPTVMVATSGFSAAAINHLVAEGIEIMVVTIREAEALRWIPHVEKEFAVDRAFREITGHLVESLRNGNPRVFFDTDLPYEEWLAVFQVGLLCFPDSTRDVLRALAREHPDSGVRFNAIQSLNEAGTLDDSDIEALLSTESDVEIVELLDELKS